MSSSSQSPAESREPLATPAVWGGILVGLLTLVGVHLTAVQVDLLANLIAMLGPMITGLIVWRTGRNSVTPVDSPRAMDGTPLIPDPTVGPID